MTLSTVHASEEDIYPTRTQEERWLERRDPVFWNTWTPQAPLTRAQVADFETKGYLVLEDLFSADEVDALKSESAHVRSGNAGLSPDNVVTEPGSDAVRTVFRLHEESALFKRLSCDARIAGKVAFLLDDELYVHQSRLNY